MIRYHNPVMHFYNIHTHSSNASEPDVREIVNCIIEKQKDFSLDTHLLYSVGIHPWYIFDNVKEAKQWLANAKYEDANSILILNNKTSVDCWYKQWIGFMIAGMLVAAVPTNLILCRQNMERK